MLHDSFSTLVLEPIRLEDGTGGVGRGCISVVFIAEMAQRVEIRTHDRVVPHSDLFL